MGKRAGLGVGILLVAALAVVALVLQLRSEREGAQLIRQDSTIERMQLLAAVLEGYRASYGGYPRVANIVGLKEVLANQRTLEHWDYLDGWKAKLIYQSDGSMVGLAQGYTLISCGSDGLCDSRSAASGRTPWRSFEFDLVMRSGIWVRWPSVQSVDMAIGSAQPSSMNSTTSAALGLPHFVLYHTNPAAGRVHARFRVVGVGLGAVSAVTCENSARADTATLPPGGHVDCSMRVSAEASGPSSAAVVVWPGRGQGVDPNFRNNVVKLSGSSEFFESSPR